MNTKLFWIFGTLQSLSLGTLIFLIFRSFNLITGASVVGPDTHILMSIAFPLFLLLVEHTILVKK
jgi:hypothetical protein